MQTEARLTRARAKATATPLTAPLPYTTSIKRPSSSKQTDLPRAVLFEVTNNPDSQPATSSPVNPAPEDSSEPSTEKHLAEHSLQEEAPPDSHADEELTEPEGLVADPEDACFSGCVASAPTKVEVPVSKQPCTPDSLPKAFGSPAVFTGPPESSNIDNASVTGTPRAIADVAMEDMNDTPTVAVKEAAMQPAALKPVPAAGEETDGQPAFSTPDSSPEAFGSPAVFTDPPESGNINNANMTGTPSPFSDRYVAIEAVIETPTSVAVKETVMQPAAMTPVTAAGEEADVEPAATTTVTTTATEELPAASPPAALRAIAAEHDSAVAEDAVNLADSGESTRHGGAAGSFSHNPNPELQPVQAPPNASVAQLIHGTLQPCGSSTHRSASPIIARPQPLTKIGSEFAMTRTPRKNTALGIGPPPRAPLSVDRTGHQKWSASQQPGKLSASAGMFSTSPGLFAHGPWTGPRRTSAPKTCGTPRPDFELQPYSRRFGVPTGGFTPTPEVNQACSMDQHTGGQAAGQAAASTPSSAVKCSGRGPSSDEAKLQRQLFAPSDPVSEHSDMPMPAPQPGPEETPGVLAEATKSQLTPVAIQHEPKEEPLAQQEHVQPEAAEAEELIQDSRLSLSAWLWSRAQPAAAGENQPEVLGPPAEDEAAGQPLQPQVSGSVLAKQGSAAHAARLEAVAQSWFAQPSPSPLMPFAAGSETTDGANGQQGMDVGFPSAESGLLSTPLQSSMTQPPPQQPLQQPEGADDEEQPSNHAQTVAEPGAAAMQPGATAQRLVAAVDRRVKLTKLAEQRIRQSGNIKKSRAAAAKSEAFNNLMKGGAAAADPAASNKLEPPPERGCLPTVGLLGMPTIDPSFSFAAQNPTTQRNADQENPQPSVPRWPVGKRPGIPESGRQPKAAGKPGTQGPVRRAVTGPSARKQAALAKLEAQHAPLPSRFSSEVPVEGPTLGELVAMEEGSGPAAGQKGSSWAPGVQPSEASTFIPRSLRQLKKEVKSELAAKEPSRPAQSNASSSYTDVYIPARKASEDDEAISSLTDAIGGLGIASGSPMPLRGVPVRQGQHLHFDDDGEASAATPKVLLRGVPVASGKHKRFDK